ncbi:MAG TPA: long-chain-fatty-acid--CoA ligase [Thermopolyspora sp.]
MDYQLTINAILRRAERFTPGREIVTRLPDRSFHRYTYADLARRARRLGSALTRLGLAPGSRVATLCWGHHQHVEVYFGAPIAGFVTHPVNPRLHPDDIAHILTHAHDQVLIVDESLLGVYDQVRDRMPIEHVIVTGDAYEALLATGADDWTPPDLDEHTTALLTYTSGTTGRPKGVEVSHRAIALHTLSSALPDWLGIAGADCLMPVVPMYHALAWGWPYSAALLGAKLVLPGPLLDPVSLLEDIEGEQVTVTGGVPTVWANMLRTLDADPGRFDVSSLRAVLSGGSAAPPAMIEAYEKRHGVNLVHTWGMTEMIMGMISRDPGKRAMQGLPMPFVEIRARGEQGLVPWDGHTMGELEVRGAWVATEYVDAPQTTAERWTDDGWMRTGDIVTIDDAGYVEIKDRAKDLIKSGGEWISTVTLENALLDHPAVAEAAVVAVPDPKWAERPLAIVVLRGGASAGPDDLRGFLAERVPKWWLPERFEMVGQLPKTAVGKISKAALRETYAAGTGDA